MAVDLKRHKVWMYTTEYRHTTFDENVKEGVMVSDTKTSTLFNWKMYYNTPSLDDKIFFAPFLILHIFLTHLSTIFAL